MKALTRPAELLVALSLATSAFAIMPAVSAAVSVAASGPGETVVGWGNNSDGQLGDGTTTDVSPPVFVELSDQRHYTTVRAGLGTGVALATSGAVFAWGDNSYGQLGDGTTMPRLTPVRTRLPAGVRVTAVREGGQFTVALTTAGQVLAWGDNSGGALGDGTDQNRALPVRVKLPRGVTVTAISAGAGSTLALTKSGRVLSWGGNDVGQLGDGTDNGRSIPGYVRIPRHTKITSIAAGNATGFAVTSAGRVLAWGYNGNGELGDGTIMNRLTPVQVQLPAGVKVAAVTAGGLHTLALTTDGRALGWGDNFYGQLGNSTVMEEHVPVLIKMPNGAKVRMLAAGRQYSMALTTGGRVLAWGHNDVGQLGDGSTTDSATPVRVHLPPRFTPTAIGAGWDTESGLAIGHQVRDAPAASTQATATTAAASGGTVAAWGADNWGQLGDGTTTDTSLAVRTQLPPLLRYTTVRTSQDTSVALTTSGVIYAWGGNIDGQLGDGTTTTRLTPEPIRLPGGAKTAAVRESGSFTMALTTKGQVVAWGDNFYGELGDGTTQNQAVPEPVRLPKGVTITAISAGSDSALALTSSGRVLSWGDDLVGQLGDGRSATRLVPGYVRLPKHTKITSIAAGNGTGFAVTSAGRLLAWGYNHYGQLGDGTRKIRRSPVQVRLPAGVKVAAATAGGLHTLALTTDGRALAWGYNFYGQLGDGTTISHQAPELVRLPGGTKVRSLAAGQESSMALTASGRVLTWGRNELGQLGDGSTANSATPVRVHLPPGYTAVAIGCGWDAESGLAITRPAS